MQPIAYLRQTYSCFCSLAECIWLTMVVPRDPKFRMGLDILIDESKEEEKISRGKGGMLVL